MKDTQYLGKMCLYGHEYENTGRSLRRKSNYRCVECRAMEGKKYYTKNKERIAAYQRKWSAENREKAAAYQRKWSIENREGIAIRHLKWCVKNRGVISVTGKKYYTKNKERIAASRKDQSNNLTDAYIRSRLVKRSPLCSADIPIELIALKREEIKLKRLIKECKK